MTDVKTKVTAAMQSIVTDIAGADRHGHLLTKFNKGASIGIYHKTRESLAKYLSVCLKKREGVILTSGIYAEFTQAVPFEIEMKFFQQELEKFDLSIACIYTRHPDSELVAALFIIIHRDINKALEFKDRLNEALGMPEQKPAAMLVKTFIKVSETLGRDVTMPKLIDACQLLEKDEVYCISMNMFEFFNIDPNQVATILDDIGFVVCPLVKPSIDPDTPEDYKQFESLIGLLISRTAQGVEWGQKNVGAVLQVCGTAEEDILKATTTAVLQ